MSKNPDILAIYEKGKTLSTGIAVNISEIFSPYFLTCVNLGQDLPIFFMPIRIRINVGIKTEIRIRIGIKTMPIHNTAAPCHPFEFGSNIGPKTKLR
jgi:hypothetical protein